MLDDGATNASSLEITANINLNDVTTSTGSIIGEVDSTTTKTAVFNFPEKEVSQNLWKFPGNFENFQCFWE